MEAIVYAAQKPLRATYKVTPAAALVTDHALPWRPARIRPRVWSPTCSVLNSPAWRST